MNQTRVLIVDDDMVTRAMLRHSLQEFGYPSSEASDGVAALEILAEQRHQVVISDWNMPGMDGLELCRQLRKHDTEGYVYTILLTSNNDPQDRVAGLEAGADDFVGKPFNTDELMRRIAVGERVLQLETREALIFALAKLAESRDTETGNHLERVQRYAKFLSEELRSEGHFADQIDDDFIQMVFQCSPLHDIGKVGIPDSVLLHPGKLSESQFKLMKTHTTIAADCLQGAIAKSPQARFLQVAYDIALHHHERYDGSGYPTGLSGEDIPLSARIVAVADVYDALRTERVYKPAFSHQKAKSIIETDSGTHFDPTVVAAFSKRHLEFEAIARRFHDAPETNQNSADCPTGHSSFSTESRPLTLATSQVGDG